MRVHRIALAAAAAALLAGCDGGATTAPGALAKPTPPRAVDDQCVDNCGGGTVPPPYYYGSSTSISRSWKQTGPNTWAVISIHKGSAWSQVNSYDYASGRVDGVAYTYELCRTGNQRLYGQQSQTVYGIGTAQVNFRYENSTKFGFQVRGTHTFTGAPGTWVGTQTFYSEASHCDDSVL